MDCHHGTVVGYRTVRMKSFLGEMPDPVFTRHRHQVIIHCPQAIAHDIDPAYCHVSVEVLATTPRRGQVLVEDVVVGRVEEQEDGSTEIDVSFRLATVSLRSPECRLTFVFKDRSHTNRTILVAHSRPVHVTKRASSATVGVYRNKGQKKKKSE